MQNRRRFLVNEPDGIGLRLPLGALRPAPRVLEDADAAGHDFSGQARRDDLRICSPSTDTAEAFYRFEVPEHGISELFLFVGTVLEPRVAFDITQWISALLC